MQPAVLWISVKCAAWFIQEHMGAKLGTCFSKHQVCFLTCISCAAVYYSSWLVIFNCSSTDVHVLTRHCHIMYTTAYSSSCSIFECSLLLPNHARANIWPSMETEAATVAWTVSVFR